MWKTHRKACERHMGLLANLRTVDEALAELWEEAPRAESGDEAGHASAKGGDTGGTFTDARARGALHEPSASEAPPPPPLIVGTRAVIVGTKRPDLNGKRGQVTHCELYGYLGATIRNVHAGAPLYVTAPSIGPTFYIPSRQHNDRALWDQAGWRRTGDAGAQGTKPTGIDGHRSTTGGGASLKDGHLAKERGRASRPIEREWQGRGGCRCTPLISNSDS